MKSYPTKPSYRTFAEKWVLEEGTGKRPLSPEWCFLRTDVLPLLTNRTRWINVATA